MPPHALASLDGYLPHLSATVAFPATAANRKLDDIHMDERQVWSARMLPYILHLVDLSRACAFGILGRGF